VSVFRLLIVLCAILTCQKVACAKNKSELRLCTLGNGYPGRVLPYAATPELEAKLDRFRLSAGWYVRDKPPPDCHVDYRKCPTNAIPYLLYTPRNGPRPVPMIIYFGGLGEHGTDLGKQFRQTKVFEKVADLNFQKRHPCYLFAPMLPEGGVIRCAQPTGSSQLADLTCDAMYAVIKSLKSPRVDTNRLYATGLSWGGVASFELLCSYPGRFAACVPISCIQSPLRIPFSCPGNYWLFHNETAYVSEGSVAALAELEKTVCERGGDFRRSTYPDLGHDAWSKAWREESVWEWMFSKESGSQSRPKTRYSEEGLNVGRGSLPKAKCTACLPGMDAGHGAERFLDGLDETAYISCRPAQKGDWVEVVFDEPVKGRFRIYSGLRDGSSRLSSAAVEISTDGKHWSRAGVFSAKTGEAAFDAKRSVRYMRVVYNGQKPIQVTLRKIVRE